MSEVGFDSCGCFWPGGESKIQHGIVGPLESGLSQDQLHR